MQACIYMCDMLMLIGFLEIAVEVTKQTGSRKETVKRTIGGNHFGFRLSCSCCVRMISFSGKVFSFDKYTIKIPNFCEALLIW